QTTFTIPNLNKEERRVPISSVVLSSQRVDMKDAIYDAEKSKDREKAEAVNPLMQDGKKVIPSVTRVFSSNRTMYVFLQASKPISQATPATATAPTDPLMAFVSFYSSGSEVFKTAPLAVPPNAATRLGITPLSFNLGLGKLAPGSYDCQITVFDPATAKAN